MATLSAANVKAIWDHCYAPGPTKTKLKALAGGLPSRAQRQAAIQAIEDRIVGVFPQIKTDIETAIGQSISNALAQEIVAAYLRWKIANILGS